MSGSRLIAFTILVVVASSLSGARSRLAAQTPEETTVVTATQVLDEIMAIPAKQIPQNLLQDAHAVAIVPNVLKGGFVVGIRHGRGVVLIRDQAGDWQAPLFMELTGGSVGWQAGVQAADVVLVFRTPRSVAGLMSGKMTIGVDAAGAAGPVGRQASAATDARLGAEILSYSRTRGLFAGVSFDGSSLQVDQLATASYYRMAPPIPGQPSGPPGTVPPSAITLVNRLRAYAGNANPAATTPATTPTNPPAANAALPGIDHPTPDAMRDTVARSWTKLSLHLDENWRRYLSLPNEIFIAGQSPSVQDVKTSLENFTKVAQDERYAGLTHRPEFQATYRALLDYFEIRSEPIHSPITLPPPPSGF